MEPWAINVVDATGEYSAKDGVFLCLGSGIYDVINIHFKSSQEVQASLLYVGHGHVVTANILTNTSGSYVSDITGSGATLDQSTPTDIKLSIPAARYRGAMLIILTNEKVTGRTMTITFDGQQN